MNIHIKTIPGKDQRYPTCGDYFDTPEGKKILITIQKDERYEKLIILHELIECWLAEHVGLPEQVITDYDLDWEERPQPKEDEPGNGYDCPYRDLHRIAENFERQLAVLLRVDWETYSNDLQI